MATTNTDQPSTAPPLPGKSRPAAQDTSEPITATSPDVAVPPAKLDTPQTDAAIDDIVAHEADEVLAVQDASTEAAAEAVADEPKPKRHGHPVFWFIIFALALFAVLAAVILTNPGLELPFSG